MNSSRFGGVWLGLGLTRNFTPESPIFGVLTISRGTQDMGSTLEYFLKSLNSSLQDGLFIPKPDLWAYTTLLSLKYDVALEKRKK